MTLLNQIQDLKNKPFMPLRTLVTYGKSKYIYNVNVSYVFSFVYMYLYIYWRILPKIVDFVSELSELKNFCAYETLAI